MEYKRVVAQNGSYLFYFKLQSAEERAQKEGWIDADDLEKELGVS